MAASKALYILGVKHAGNIWWPHDWIRGGSDKTGLALWKEVHPPAFPIVCSAQRDRLRELV